MRYTLHIAFDEKIGELILRVNERTKRFGQVEAPALNPLLFTPMKNGFEVKRPEKSCPEAEFIAYSVDISFGILLQWTATNKAYCLEGNDAITDFFEKEYIHNVTVNSSFEPELHLMLYVPLYKKSIVDYVRKIIDCVPVSYKVIVNIVAIPYDVAEAATFLDSTIERIERNKIMRKTMMQLVNLRKEHEELRYVIFFQNRNVGGWSIDFDKDKLVGTLSDIAINFIANYDNVAKYVEDGKPILVINSQSYVLDIFYALNKWINNLFKSEADMLIINETDNDGTNIETDILFKNILQKENQAVKDFVSSIELNAHEYSIEELDEEFKDKCAKKIQEIIDEECKDKDVTIRHKLYNKFKSIGGIDTNATEDVIAESLEHDRLIVENLTIGDDVKEAYELLEKYLNEMKLLKIQIENEEAEVDSLKGLLSETDYQYLELTEDGVMFGKNIFKPNKAKDQPLAETYNPSLNTVLPSSVDLRPLFPVIKNQGHQGACSAFSLVAVYEYFLMRISGQHTDLSEAYAYYNSRKQAGNTDLDEGANFNDVLQAASNYGLCLEQLCPYDENVYNEEPSKESYQDGSNRLVTKAMNVQINIEHIKSALANGLPVVVSVKSFGAMKKIVNGFVCYDIIDDSAATDAYHAMVICGYSDNEGYFIVRNSWGEDFGDKGYCYIPYAAFRGSNTIESCYVVTGISNSMLDDIANNIDNSHTLYGDTATANYEIIRNIISEKTYALKENRKQLFKTRAEYSRLCKQLGETNVAELNIADIDKQIEEIRSKADGNYSKFRTLFKRKVEDDPELTKLIYEHNTILLNAVIISGLRKLNNSYLQEADLMEGTSDFLLRIKGDMEDIEHDEEKSYFRKLSPVKFNIDSLINTVSQKDNLQQMLFDLKNSIKDIYNNKIGLYEIFGEFSRTLSETALNSFNMTILDYLDDDRGVEFFNSINCSSVMAMIEGWVPTGSGNDVIYLSMPTSNPQIKTKLRDCVSVLESKDKYRITYFHVERYNRNEISLFAEVERLELKARSLADKANLELNEWLESPEAEFFFNEAKRQLEPEELVNLRNILEKSSRREKEIKRHL